MLPLSYIERQGRISKDLSFNSIVYECAMEFSLIKQWDTLSCYENMNEHFCKAEKLLEIVEVIVCGSIGGFDYYNRKESQQHTTNRRYRSGGYISSPFQRLLWIWDKYTDFNTSTKHKEFIDSLAEYFKRRS